MSDIRDLLAQFHSFLLAALPEEAAHLWPASSVSFDLIAGSAVGGIVVWLWLKLRNAARRARDRARFRAFDVSDTGNQLRFVEGAALYARRPINREAFRVYRELETFLPTRRDGCRLLAEVALGSFIATSMDTGSQGARNRAFSSFNSKRVDFLIIDPMGNPAVAVEYHGSGHYAGNATARDAVKKRAIQKAGIEFVEIFEATGNDEIRSMISHALNRHRRK